MLGKELKVGMMTEHGLVLHVSLTDDPNGIWDCPHVYWMDPQDPFYGQLSSRLILDKEYQIVCEQGTPQYREMVKKMISERAECLTYVEKDIQNLLEFI